jgi:Amt family ammonium transporter
MKKLVTSWLAGAAVLCALSAPVLAEEAKPAAAAPVAAASPSGGGRCAGCSGTAAAAAPAAAAPAAAPAAPPAEAAAAPAPVPNKGDTAWMMVATILVILMSIPGLALFYGGLVRSKNMLSILMQVFIFCADHRAVVRLRLFAGLYRR